jgi:hypothetical protein
MSYEHNLMAHNVSAHLLQELRASRADVYPAIYTKPRSGLTPSLRRGYRPSGIAPPETPAVRLGP